MKEAMQQLNPTIEKRAGLAEVTVAMRRVKALTEKARPRYHIETFGCQMNVHDSEKLAGMLEQMGYTGAKRAGEADLILMNTCCVREHAESRAFGHLGAFADNKRENPNLVVAVCGCMMQQKDVALRVKQRFPFVDIIFGTHNLHRFPLMLLRVLENRVRVFEVHCEAGGIVEGLPACRRKAAQAFVTIMQGCTNFCTYCIVPHVRGPERSRDAENILSEARGLAESGVKEITLLGQNVNAYGKDLMHGPGFADLLWGVAKIDGIERIRFMTSHPKDVSDALIEAMAGCEKVCRHIHLPVQSGSTAILRAMNRKYTKEDYLALAGRMKDAVPGLEITTDIIVGFPGETREDFDETLDLVRRAGFSAAFTFMYSPRKGTPAAKLADRVEKAVKKERLLELNALVAGMTARENEAYVGRTERVLVEGVRESGGERLYYSRTHASKTLCFTGDAAPGDITTVTITHTRELSLHGKQAGA